MRNFCFVSHCEWLNWWHRCQIKWWNQCHGQRFAAWREKGSEMWISNGMPDDITKITNFQPHKNAFELGEFYCRVGYSLSRKLYIVTFAMKRWQQKQNQKQRTAWSKKEMRCAAQWGHASQFETQMKLCLKCMRLIHAVNWSINHSHIIRDSIDEVAVLKQNGSTTTNYGTHAIQINLPNGLSGMSCENDLFANKNIFTMLHLLCFLFCWKKISVVPAAIAAAGRCYFFSGRATCMHTEF